MTNIQTKIPFNIRKKCSFYGTKNNISKQDFTDATARDSSNKYIPRVKKVITFSSSESESDSGSDVENALAENNAELRGKGRTARTPQRTRKASKSNADDSSTSPKQKRIEKSVPATSPSTLLDKLNLISSPDKEAKLVPKKLFGSEKYRNALKALHSSLPETLPDREPELAKLEEFLEEHLKTERSGSLYVSGPPGTGKTACLSKLILKPKFKSCFKIIYINCTTMKSAAAIYSKIIQELGLPPGKNCKTIIQKYLISKHKMLLLILDELDQLESRKQSVLYSIFEWPSMKNSKLLLVGIANALDLTDRILPRLQARCELKPKLLHFTPYSKQQICNIITERLKEAEVSNLFSGTAIQLLAGKVAAFSGDIRKALDISRRVIELAGSQKIVQVLQPTNDNGMSEKQQSLTERPADLKDVIAVLNGVYGGSQNIEKEENTFPLQQKLLLCSYLLILNRGRSKDITVGKLHDVYRKVCEKRNIHAVDSSEFVSLCSLIETRGILKLTTKKEPRLSKVNLEWDQEELNSALQDKNMMGEIINDVTCL
ncbi:cell division control protein 6 homolog [Colletes gigas]|uniref:cell division control protein 6 homolog n=1 Tax=Colletes gigas TaxID=935657 RepID=UPI001C9B41FC|nr:cell division control protein 6 homolog [Colletes gigas]